MLDCEEFEIGDYMTIPSTSSNDQTASPAAAAGNTGTSSSQTSGIDKLANESTFLQLFVAQLKNQDPLNPAEGTQFVSQLAQFSQLEQTINIGQDVSAIRQVAQSFAGSQGTTNGVSGAQQS